MTRFEGSRVHLEGSLVNRDDQTMIELSDARIREFGGESLAAHGPSAGVQDLRERPYGSEIVASKYPPGVMHPDRGTTHRACATRGIAGGMLPVLRAASGGGGPRYLLLDSPQSEARREEVPDCVADPVEITGYLLRLGSLHVLASDPRSIHRLP